MMNGLSFDVGNTVVDRQTGRTLAVAAIDVENNIDLLLQLLDDHGCRATFFVLGSFARQWPRLIRLIAGGGHEIASQGYRNEPLSRFTRYAFRRDAVQAKDTIEAVTGRRVLGYRASGFSLGRDCLWAIDILREIGFRYDSSISPAAIPAGFRVSNGEQGFFTFENGLREFPLASFKLLRVNFMLSGATYFKIIPHLVTRLLLRLMNRKGREFIYCYHPSELGASHAIDLRRRYRELCRAEVRLRCLLREFHFQPLREFLPDGSEPTVSLQVNRPAVV